MAQKILIGDLTNPNFPDVIVEARQRNAAAAAKAETATVDEAKAEAKETLQAEIAELTEELKEIK